MTAVLSNQVILLPILMVGYSVRPIIAWPLASCTDHVAAGGSWMSNSRCTNHIMTRRFERDTAESVGVTRNKVGYDGKYHTGLIV